MPAALGNFAKVAAARRNHNDKMARMRGKTTTISRPNSTTEWQRWQENQDKFRTAIFEKYDTNESGVLEKNEVAKLMQDMNDGKEVNCRDVDDLVGMCDKTKDGSINKNEVLFAIKMWNDHLKTLPKVEVVEVGSCKHHDHEQPNFEHKA